MSRVGALLVLLLAGCTVQVSGLMPIEPGPDNAVVSSLLPTLRWEPLPEAGDSRVSELVYDVRLCRPSGLIVWERTELTDCSFRPEQPLSAGTEYTWTVRARFRWEGARRRTAWTRLSGPDERWPLPGETQLLYLPFRTPAH